MDGPAGGGGGERSSLFISTFQLRGGDRRESLVFFQSLGKISRRVY